MGKHGLGNTVILQPGEIGHGQQRLCSFPSCVILLSRHLFSPNLQDRGYLRGSCVFISQNRLPGSEVKGIHPISPGSQAEDETTREAARQQFTSPLVAIAKPACQDLAGSKSQCKTSQFSNFLRPPCSPSPHTDCIPLASAVDAPVCIGKPGWPSLLKR